MTITASESAARIRFRSRKADLRTDPSTNGQSMAPGPAPMVAKRPAWQAGTQRPGPVAAIAHVRPLASSVERWAAASIPTAPPETTTAPNPTSAEQSASVNLVASSVASREPMTATVHGASRGPPQSASEAGACTKPRSRDGYAASSGVKCLTRLTHPFGVPVIRVVPGPPVAGAGVRASLWSRAAPPPGPPRFSRRHPVCTEAERRRSGT